MRLTVITLGLVLLSAARGDVISDAKETNDRLRLDRIEQDISNLQSPRSLPKPKPEPVFVPGETDEQRTKRHVEVTEIFKAQHRAKWQEANPFIFSERYPGVPAAAISERLRESDRVEAAKAAAKLGTKITELDQRVSDLEQPKPVIARSPTGAAKQPSNTGPAPARSGQSIMSRKLADGRVMVVAGPIQRIFANEADANAYIAGYKSASK